MSDRVTWGGAGRGLGPPLTPAATEQLRGAGRESGPPSPNPWAARNVWCKRMHSVVWHVRPAKSPAKGRKKNSCFQEAASWSPCPHEAPTRVAFPP